MSRTASYDIPELKEPRSCRCRVCTDHQRWLEALDPQTEQAKAAFDEILSRLEAAETDAAVSNAKLEGKWPGYEPHALFTRPCSRCGKDVAVKDAAGLMAAVVYCSVECAD